LILESTPDQKPNTYKCNPLPKTHHFALPETEPGRHPWFTFFLTPGNLNAYSLSKTH